VPATIDAKIGLAVVALKRVEVNQDDLPTQRLERQWFGVEPLAARDQLGGHGVDSLELLRVKGWTGDLAYLSLLIGLEQRRDCLAFGLCGTLGCFDQVVGRFPFGRCGLQRLLGLIYPFSQLRELALLSRAELHWLRDVLAQQHANPEGLPFQLLQPLALRSRSVLSQPIACQALDAIKLLKLLSWWQDPRAEPRAIVLGKKCFQPEDLLVRPLQLFVHLGSMHQREQSMWNQRAILGVDELRNRIALRSTAGSTGGTLAMAPQGQ
jgi:hypothetical protein